MKIISISKKRKYQHQELASGRWAKLTFFEQMANVGSEVERILLWKEKGNQKYSQMAFERALELIDLTILLPSNRNRLKEITRLRELLIDHFFAGNLYSSSPLLWRKYFYPFTFAARRNR